MGVNRCICNTVPFTVVKALVRDEALSLEQVMQRTGCCTGCGMCTPYVRMVMQTGEIDFPPMADWLFERLLGPDALSRPAVPGVCDEIKSKAPTTQPNAQ